MPDEFPVKGEAHPASIGQPSLPVANATPAALALHNNFRNAVGGLRRELVRTIYYLQVIHDRKIFRVLGYTNILPYAADHGGLTEAQCKAFLRIGARLDDLPAMKKALVEGSLTWRKANAIVGEADPENEQELVNLACGLSSKALREALSKAAPQAAQQAAPQASPMVLPQAAPQASPLAPSKGAPPPGGHRPGHPHRPADLPRLRAGHADQQPRHLRGAKSLAGNRLL
ncbi:MAG: hypothetical protein AB7V45_11770 [Candidatus Krumholzibacteriia bacterium]